MDRSGVIEPHPDAAGDKPAKAGFAQRLWRWLARTPVRTFLVYPLVVIAFEMLRQGGTLQIVPWGALLLVWGYAQYRLVGSYRRRHGGGGPGPEVPPQRIVADGLYRYTRNPMYLAHLIFLTGLALTFRSWLALAILILSAAWFHRRVLADEAQLRALFGAPYVEYCRRVKRWVPGVL